MDSTTASAWEIIAWALDERADALTIGEKTFGKWSIQTLKDIDEHASLKYTIGKRFTPNDSNIDEEWLIPDIVVEFDAAAFLSGWVDNQLESAKTEILKLVQ